ncbi:MFS transporter [Rhodococcus triatomae]|uniref:MFS transporter n=1 Tax=Rhodococcus triatomae TaxID=300028 RepID=UPI00093414E3|nr:MFS transporter [Rhodococcus triatomae]QNG21587.1 MFS transporter [Rhodococcus triatomae]QNG25674.1 MFS transporter [Rhodococcus triatomae]
MIIAVLVAVEIISAFETSMVFAALPTFIREFDSDAATVGWAVTAFLLVAAASAAVCGRLGDMYGRERVLVILLATAAVGSLVSALGDSIGSVIVGRAIQGVAGAILPLCIGLARSHLPAAKVPVAVAIISGSAIAAGSASLLVAGVMLDHASWHMIFVVAAVYAVFALLLVVFVLPWRPAPGTTQRVDYIGTLAFAPAIAAVLLGINKSGEWGFADPRTLGFVLGGLAVLAMWVAWELRVPDPIVNVKLFTDRKVALTMCATLAIAIGPMGVSTMIIPMILQSPTTAPFGLGISPTNAGLLSFVGSLFGFVFTPLSGRITRAVGSRAAMLLGTTLFTVSSAMMLLLHDSVIGMAAMIVTVSIGTAFAFTALPNLIVEAVPEGNTSEATGTNAVLRTGGQGIGTSIATMLLASSATAATGGAPSVSGLNTVGAMMIVAGLVTLGFTLLIRRGSVYTDRTST